MLEIILIGGILSSIVLLLVVWLLYWCCAIIYYEFYLRKIPGPIPLPFVGNSLELKDPAHILSRLMTHYERYKGNFKVYMRSQPYLYICEPKDVEFLLNNTTILTKIERHRLMQNWMGLGLLNSDGELWRKRNRILAPAFHFRILEGFIEVFNSKSDILVSKLMQELDKDYVDIYPYVSRCMLDLICETAMGTSMNIQENINSEYVKNVCIVSDIITQRFMSPILSNDTLYSYTSECKKEKEALEVIHGYSRSVIKTRKDEFFGHVKKLEAIDYLGIKHRRALLDLLLEYSSKDSSFTEECIREEVDTFMVSGQTTLASAVAFTLYSLANHADIQEKVYAELKTVFGDDLKRHPIRKDLQEMTYLETVIMESLRMYPIIPTFGRKLEEDVKFNDTVYPKGLMMCVFVYAIQNSELFYEEPHKFNPDRFSKENYAKIERYVYVPFSAGPRTCAGRKFALLALKAIISNIMRNFELLPSIPEHTLSLKGDAVLRANNGVLIRLKLRN